MSTIAVYYASVETAFVSRRTGLRVVQGYVVKNTATAHDGIIERSSIRRIVGHNAVLSYSRQFLRRIERRSFTIVGVFNTDCTTACKRKTTNDGASLRIHTTHGIGTGAVIRIVDLFAERISADNERPLGTIC